MVEILVSGWFLVLLCELCPVLRAIVLIYNFHNLWVSVTPVLMIILLKKIMEGCSISFVDVFLGGGEFQVTQKR